MEELIERIEFLSPENGEVIILYYTKTSMLNEIQEIIKELVKEFPDNKIIAIEKHYSLSIAEKDNLIQFLQS